MWPLPHNSKPVVLHFEEPETFGIKSRAATTVPVAKFTPGCEADHFVTMSKILRLFGSIRLQRLNPLPATGKGDLTRNRMAAAIRQVSN